MGYQDVENTKETLKRNSMIEGDFEISDDDEVEKIRDRLNFKSRKDINNLLAVNYRETISKSRKVIATNAKALAEDIDFQLYQTYTPA